MLSVPVLFQYVLNDKISYPEETFMDWEFKISVMYDIAKVRQKLLALLMSDTYVALHCICCIVFTFGILYWLKLYGWLRSRHYVFNWTKTQFALEMMNNHVYQTRRKIM